MVPSATRSASIVVDVFWRGTDANLWHKRFTGVWNGPESLGAGPLGSGPSAAGQPSGTIDVFWAGTDAQVWHEWFSGGWNGPEPMGGSVW